MRTLDRKCRRVISVAGLEKFDDGRKKSLGQDSIQPVPIAPLSVSSSSSPFNGSADSSVVSAASRLGSSTSAGHYRFFFGVISSIRAPSPISFSIASALALSFVVSTVRQYGFSKTLTMYVVAGLSFIARPANLLCG
ncbi:hypothetical protein [Mesorhizobium sp. M0522]|uniref:hypothetical protein n=1 Tax=Mesorhizobium sp. M0522 TaxID=2956958 RepID=UPI00333684F7